MGHRWKSLAFGALALLIFAQSGNQATAYDSQVYDNLNRTRDALLDQRQHLKTVYNDVSGQIAALQDKLSRVNSYLQQNDQAIKDVENALNRLQ